MFSSDKKKVAFRSYTMKDSRPVVYALVILSVGVADCKNTEIARLDPFDQFLEDVVPLLFHQKPNNENGTDSRFENYALRDESNEEIGNYTMQQIVARSGFKFKNHVVLSDDGYMTQITRIINPYADPSQLKQPPVMMLHGGIIDPTAYVWGSAIQHHPEPYPRTEASGPMTSWNRSLAFTLANNGYDVWLIGTRGSDSQNQGHIKFKGAKSIDHSGEMEPEFDLRAKLEAHKYWDFSMDEIIKYELPRQVDKVLELSGARNVTLFTFSLSTMTGPPFTGGNLEYADKVHNMVVMAPIVNNRGANRFITLLHDIFTILPTKFGTAIVTEILFTRFLRSLVLLINKVRYFRYTLVKLIASLLTGPSAKYHTLLEPGVMGHIFMPVGFKLLKHWSQQVKHARLERFDHGLVKNEFVYGHARPPAYSIVNLNIKNWLLVSATNDNLATPKSVKQFLNQVNPKPYQHIIAPHFSHLDLVAAFENDIYVNHPIIEFLEQFKLPPQSAQRDGLR